VRKSKVVFRCKNGDEIECVFRLDERVEYINECKPVCTQNFCPDCPWNGETIFPMEGEVKINMDGETFSTRATTVWDEMGAERFLLPHRSFCPLASFRDCWKEDCAWWNEEKNCCSMVAIAKELSRIQVGGKK